jgi:glycosyltransferase involved in cell wall biosynthesis
MTVITPSRWLGDLAQQSDLWPNDTRFHVIRYGLDLKQFRAIDKQQARRELGLDTDAVLIGFGAEDINNHRKGFQHLLPALEQLQTDQPAECLVFGSGEIPDNFTALPPVHAFGYLDSPEKQVRFYSACDLVVVPSEEDNQPQVGLEAMACGTPVIGFDTGGIAEYVLPDETGLLAKLGDVEQLSHQIARLVDEPELRLQMGRNARRMMDDEFEVAAQTGKYLDVYRELIDQPALQAAG